MNLAIFLSEAGLPGPALAAAQEAVTLYQALAIENPQAFTPQSPSLLLKFQSQTLSLSK